MLATNSSPRPQQPRPAPQQGLAAVEFGLIAVVFFTLVFGAIELARIIYVINTLQEVTRRAASGAASTSFRDIGKLDSVRYKAIFRDTAGPLLLADPVTDQDIRVDYMALVANAGALTMTPIATGALPACAAENRKICLTNPNSASCIRFVRARVCDHNNVAACDPVKYKPFVSLVQLALDLPPSTAIVQAETLGFIPGTTACP
jgi:hypothetical protein